MFYRLGAIVSTHSICVLRISVLLTLKAILRASYAHLRVQVAEISLHAVASDVDQFTTMMPPLQNSWYHSSARTEILIRCLQVGKDYLDALEKSLEPSSYTTANSKETTS
ncbi:hypothetical protein NHQ30_004663 [Ciborinia camelliae]|nr:hypothetical protein NHQ30_004663 [Ciborinia camelliae]